MKLSADIRALGEDAIEQGMAEKAAEFRDLGGEIYLPSASSEPAE